MKLIKTITQKNITEYIEKLGDLEQSVEVYNNGWLRSGAAECALRICFLDFFEEYDLAEMVKTLPVYKRGNVKWYYLGDVKELALKIYKEFRPAYKVVLKKAEIKPQKTKG